MLATPIDFRRHRHQAQRYGAASRPTCVRHKLKASSRWLLERAAISRREAAVLHGVQTDELQH